MDDELNLSVAEALAAIREACTEKELISLETLMGVDGRIVGFEVHLCEESKNEKKSVVDSARGFVPDGTDGSSH